jgi:putative sterol carrier protein
VAGAPNRATDPTAEFFDELAQRGHEPLLRKASGSVRFDIADGKKIDRRFVVIDKGTITVSRRNTAADGVLRADRAFFDRIATGRVNAVAAVLRGELVIEGDWRLLVLVQRLFPGPPRSRGRRAAAGRRRRS